MRVVLQSVLHASVRGPNIPETKTIGRGVIVYVGFSNNDDEVLNNAVTTFAKKLPSLKLFADEHGKLSQSLTDIQGDVLIISNFTIRWRNHKGASLDFSRAASYDRANHFYTCLVEAVKQYIPTVQTGVFGAHMLIESTVDGPVNLVLDV